MRQPAVSGKNSSREKKVRREVFRHREKGWMERRDGWREGWEREKRKGRLTEREKDRDRYKNI